MGFPTLRTKTQPGLGIGLLAAAAVAAAATAIWTEWRARRAEREHPPVGDFVEVDGVRLHYVDRGEGPAVVLIHGNGVMLQDFIASGLIDRLAATHRVIAFDRPGFGYSDRPRKRLWTVSAQAELLHAAFAKLGIERPVVLGHSLGTLVALALALDHPDDVGGLVLAGGYYFPTARIDAALNLPVALPIIGDVMRYTVMPISSRMTLKAGVKAMFAPKPIPDDFLATLSGEMMVRPVQLRAAIEDGVFMIGAAMSLSKRYGELRMPVAIIAGDGDKIVDIEAHSERLHGALAQSTLTVVPDTGHMVHYAVPESVEAEIDRVARDGAASPPSGATRASTGVVTRLDPRRAGSPASPQGADSPVSRHA